MSLPSLPSPSPPPSFSDPFNIISKSEEISVTGLNLQLLVDPFTPVPQDIIKSIISIEVTNTDSGRDAFQIKLSTGKTQQDSSIDYSFFNSSLLKFPSRLIIILNIGVSSTILIDGFITNHSFSPSETPGRSIITLTGEDYSVIMDMHQRRTSHPNQSDLIIVNKIILQYGLIPVVIPPPQIIIPDITTQYPMQNSTDLQYVIQLALKYNYIFYIEPTDTPGLNKAYWTPKQTIGVPQKPIIFNMGALSNCSSLSFQNNALKPTTIFGTVQDKKLANAIIPVIVPAPLPPFFSKIPAHFANIPFIRTEYYQSNGEDTVADAYIYSIGKVNESKDVITATGEIDVKRYGRLIRARKTILVHGPGENYSGIFYVNNVTTKIERGSCKQTFTLSRDGTGPSSIGGL